MKLRRIVEVKGVKSLKRLGLRDCNACQEPASLSMRIGTAHGKQASGTVLVLCRTCALTLITALSQQVNTDIRREMERLEDEE